jgi:hypothetical protein
VNTKERERAPVRIRRALLLGELDARGGEKGPTNKEIAEKASCNYTRYSEFRNVRGAGTPSFAQAIDLAHELRFPIDRMPDEETPNLLRRAGGIAWRLSGGILVARDHALRLAADGVLAGEAPDAIEGRIRRMLLGRGKAPGALNAARLREMAEGGLVLGCVEIALSGSGGEVEDPDLAAELADALRKDSPVGWAPALRVVRNVAHPAFGPDPAAPFLAALVAHRLVAEFMERNENVYYIGLAGGAHCQAFVASIGAGSSPFPDPCGDKRLVFVPLTLEPFSDHRVPLAVGVVAQMAAAAGALLGPRRVEALTFQPVAYVSGGELRSQDSVSIAKVRDRYDDLHVAIYGCGDRGQGGWLGRLLENARIEPSVQPTTDVCLKPLSESGDEIPLSGDLRYVGLELKHIRGMIDKGDRLAILLATGAAKGLPITVVARAGCAGTVVCDQAAARAALQALARRSESEAPARPGLQKVPAPGSVPGAAAGLAPGTRRG